MHWNRLKRLLVPVLIIVVLDRWTKSWATETLAMSMPRPYWNDFFRLQYALNEGAFLSLGAELPDHLRYWVLAIVPVAVLLYLFYHALRAEGLGHWAQMAFGLILGGGGSNIYDRIAHGHVVDFMNMGIGSIRTGIFNFADVAIMLGLAILLPTAFQKPKPESTPVQEDGHQEELPEEAGRS
jgi:signal peptidase II